MVEALLAWRGDIVNAEFLKERTNGNAPVANRVTGFVKQMTGREPEERLNRRAEEIDARFSNL